MIFCRHVCGSTLQYFRVVYIANRRPVFKSEGRKKAFNRTPSKHAQLRTFTTVSFRLYQFYICIQVLTTLWDSSGKAKNPSRLTASLKDAVASICFCSTLKTYSGSCEKNTNKNRRCQRGVKRGHILEDCWV